MASCTCCPQKQADALTSSLRPMICLVPRAEEAKGKQRAPPSCPSGSDMGSNDNIQFLDEDYIRKHFKVPPRALYLDAFRRPLITFPMSQEKSNNFSLYKKTKINQQILDGTLDSSEAITAPSVFPYAPSEDEKRKQADEDEEVIYILQLPDWEYQCPVHNQTIRTPRFIWHSCKKESKTDNKEIKQGGGPMNKPKPWLLSRHVDFDLMSQW